MSLFKSLPRKFDTKQEAILDEDTVEQNDDLKLTYQFCNYDDHTILQIVHRIPDGFETPTVEGMIERQTHPDIPLMVTEYGDKIHFKGRCRHSIQKDPGVEFRFNEEHIRVHTTKLCRDCLPQIRAHLVDNYSDSDLNGEWELAGSNEYCDICGIAPGDFYNGETRVCDECMDIINDNGAVD